MITRTGEKRVILYGMGTNFAKAVDYVRLRFIVVGCSDGNPKKEELAAEYDMNFYPPSLLKEADCDFILITSIYGEEIKKDLVELYGVHSEKIIEMAQWQKMDFLHSYGEKNADKTFYLISKPMRAMNGIVSLLNVYMLMLDRIKDSDYIPVIDLQTYKNQYIKEDEVGCINGWDRFFEPLSMYSVDEVIQSKNVILGYDDPGYLCDYQQEYNFAELNKVYKKYIKFTPEVERLIEAEWDRTLKEKENIVGVLYRGTDMTALKLKKHMIQPSLEEVYEKTLAMMDKYGSDYVFLSTEDNEAVKFFRDKLGERLLCTNQQRYEDTGTSWIAQIENNRQNDLFLRGAEYIATINLLSRCDYLVSGVVAGSIGALIMNGGNYKDVCIIDKGCY